MTAKEFVLEKCPTAYARRCKSGRIKGLQKVYYLIFEQGSSVDIGEGSTESKAWIAAKEYLSSN